MYNIISQIRKTVVLGALVWAFGLGAKGQSVQYVSLVYTNATENFVSYPLQTNQTVVWLSESGGTTTYTCSTPFGRFSIPYAAGATYTGLTNVSWAAPGSFGVTTLEIITPAPPATIVSNYVPADCLVIPSSSSGNVQVILETSPDLINWTAAQPGTYSAANGTNRFFRVRAVAQ